ncbi:hypothetical protein ABZ397_03510 [Streptomyces sp. NPDC005876]|uniref:hypothetical protein n=1 Tax=Streptomyces sp. NPDC005876 TaxID=3157076 RepID=UPI0033C2C11A
MSNWDQISVDVVDGISLDPRNVRIELNEGAPEADIIQDLFHNEKALTLVESICKVGFLTHELPIAVKRSGKNVVVEGNRRIAALKAIQNPFLVPEYQARITRITQSIERDALRRVAVKVAPTQDDADQLIAAIHTGNQRVGWSPARQAAFFQAQIDAGKDPEYLIQHYPTVDVKKFIVRSRILNLFRNVEYADAQLKDYIKRRSFPVSVLARLYGNAAFLELVQVRVDEINANVTLKAPRGQFARVAEKIIGDIKEKRINTRVLNSNSADSYVAYMDELRDLVNAYEGEVETASAAPEQKISLDSSAGLTGLKKSVSNSKAGGVDPTNASSGAPRSDASRAVTPQRPAPQAEEKTEVAFQKPKAAKSIYLNLDSIQVAPSFPASIHLIRQELALINVKNFPNAAMDLLRTFLEKSIKAYAESIGQSIKNTSNQNGFVQMSHCLTWLEEHLKSSKQTAYLQVISKIRGNPLGGYIPTVDHMNAINHNHQVFATADDVKSCWSCMEGLVKVMLKP